MMSLYIQYFLVKNREDTYSIYKNILKNDSALLELQ